MCLDLLSTARFAFLFLQNSTQVKWNDIEKDIREWDDIIAKLEDLFTLESFLNMGYYYEASITDENRPKLLIRGFYLNFCL